MENKRVIIFGKTDSEYNDTSTIIKSYKSTQLIGEIMVDCLNLIDKWKSEPDCAGEPTKWCLMVKGRLNDQLICLDNTHAKWKLGEFEYIEIDAVRVAI